jgi:hypothetical protein
MAVGLVDINIVVHAHMTDAQSQECQDFLGRLRRGEEQAELDMLVVHELTYVLPRVMKQMDRRQVAAYVLMVLGWPGIMGDKATLGDVLQRWGSSHGLAFVDAYLVVRSRQEGRAIFTKNARELITAGATVPDPLPGTSTP